MINTSGSNGILYSAIRQSNNFTFHNRQESSLQPDKEASSCWVVVTISNPAGRVATNGLFTFYTA
ncbi:MAG: hypothetical protein R2847_04945 [Bacteroidia bacterium]